MIAAPEGSIITEDGSLVSADGIVLAPPGSILTEQQQVIQLFLWHLEDLSRQETVELYYLLMVLIASFKDFWYENIFHTEIWYGKLKKYAFKATVPPSLHDFLILNKY